MIYDRDSLSQQYIIFKQRSKADYARVMYNKVGARNRDHEKREQFFAVSILNSKEIFTFAVRENTIIIILFNQIMFHPAWSLPTRKIKCRTLSRLTWVNRIRTLHVNRTEHDRILWIVFVDLQCVQFQCRRRMVYRNRKLLLKDNRERIILFFALITIIRLTGFWSFGFDQVPIVGQRTCRAAYRRYLITDNMFCAGYRDGRSDTCSGDSGGPLLCQMRGRWTVVGVTSFGDGCGRRGKYGIYASVANQMPWITSTITKSRGYHRRSYTLHWPGHEWLMDDRRATERKSRREKNRKVICRMSVIIIN